MIAAPTITPTFADYGIEIPPGRSGEVDTLCPKCSHTRKQRHHRCLSVNTHTGVFLCHHCGWSGVLGTADTTGYGARLRTDERPRRQYAKPEPAPDDSDLPAHVLAWFADRGISGATVRRNRIDFADGAIRFPYFRNGELINIKHRGQGKRFWMVKDAERILYGLDDCPGTEDVIVVEGEMDKLAFEEAGYRRCLSVPDGAPAPGAANYAGKFDFLASTDVFGRANRVLIATDADGPGQKLAEELIRRIGSGKCWQVHYPPDCKDANDVLLKLGREGLQQLLDEATPSPSEGPATAPSQTAGLLRFRTAREIAEATPERPEWISEPWAVAGGVTEISGKIKSAGKTTFTTNMCEAILNGKPFLGRPTTRTAILYLTEQADSSLREALRRANILDRDDFAVLSYYDARHLSWPEIVEASVVHARSIGARMIVVDTLPQWAGIRGEGENSSGEALRAMEPLQAAAGIEGIAVVVVRHDRKSGGEVGDSARGSSAFGGAVDIVIQIQRNEGNSRPTIRVINALSRYDETPDQLVIELTEEGYISHGDKSAVATEEARASLIKAAPSTEETAKTVDDLAAVADVKRTTAHDTVKYLFEWGQLCRTGTGYRGSPYRYWRPDAGRDQIHSSVPKVEEPDESKFSDARMETKGLSIDSSGTRMAPDESISRPATATDRTGNGRAIDSSGTSTLGTDESISDQHRAPSERVVLAELVV